MFLDHGYLIYASSELLFESLLLKFEFCDDDQKGTLVEILVDMMAENKKLVKLANQPYYFLEYFLHDINQCTCVIKQRLNWTANCTGSIP